MNAEMSLIFTFTFKEQYETFFELETGVNAKSKRNLFTLYVQKFLKQGRERPQMILLATAKNRDLK